MRLLDSILLALSVAFFIIGVHQVMTIGLMYSYWLFMLSLICLFWVNMRRRKAKEAEEQNNTKKYPGKKNKKTTR